MIRVYADLDTCLARVRSRDSAEQIPIPDAKVAEYNAIAAQVQYPWAAEIDNSAPATEAAILAVFHQL